MIRRKSNSFISYAIDAPQLLYPLVEAIVKICLQGDSSKPFPSTALTDKQFKDISEELLERKLVLPDRGKVEQKIKSFCGRFENCLTALNYYSKQIQNIQDPEKVLEKIAPVKTDSPGRWATVCLFSLDHIYPFSSIFVSLFSFLPFFIACY